MKTRTHTHKVTQTGTSKYDSFRDWSVNDDDDDEDRPVTGATTVFSGL